MASKDTLPRVLTNPKLHRRQIVEASFVRKNNNETKKHKCPPIDATKEKIPTEDGTHATDPVLISQADRNLLERPNAPFSPVDVSPACTAMVNACCHDHDYSSNEPAHQNASRHMSELSLNLDFNEEGNLRPRTDMKTITRVPVPPSKNGAQKSPRDLKLPREMGVRPNRRLVKPSEVSEIGLKILQQSEKQAENKCVFISTSKTAQPRRVRSRTPRRKAVVSDENQTREKDKVLSSASSRSAATTSSSSSNIDKDNTSQIDNFDVTTDKLTVEWQNMVKKYHPQNSSGQLSDDLSADEIDPPVRHSTPDKDEVPLDCAIPSPLPSATPCPINFSRRSSRRDNRTDDQNDSTEKAVKRDSAYFSFNSSVSSLQPNQSAGNSSFRPNSQAESPSRPSTGQRSTASTRPPSVGKRLATDSLSSTSSGASSDEDSYCSSISLKMPDDDLERGKASESTVRASSADSHKSGKDSWKQEHKVKLRKGKKVVVKLKPPIHPIPPKTKKGPLPMNRRALPSSFFQEPNRVNSSPYNILPPVIPLFRQGPHDDVTNIRPVTPPEQQKLPEERHCSFTDRNKTVMIKTGDTDLLHRLFDSVDPQVQATGRKVKRGRPKRHPRILPSPKLTLDNNPCIMQSITEKLFPNLSIEKRHPKQRSVRNPVPTVLLTAEKNFVNSAEDGNLLGSGNHDIDVHENDLSQFGLLSFNSSSYEDDGVDVAMEITSPTTTQRQEVLALPQLPLSQDYSQMLTDVAAVL